MNRVCFPLFERYIGIDYSGAFQKHWPTDEDNTYVTACAATGSRGRAVRAGGG